MLFRSRVSGLVALALLWLNPGRWREENLDAKRDWLVLLDRSRSMESPLAENETRWQRATKAAGVLRMATSDQGTVRVRTFSTQLDDEIADASQFAPDGAGTDLARAVTSALDQKSTSLAGIVVISDGRATTRAKLDEVARRANGRGVPIHVVAAAGNEGVRDLALAAARVAAETRGTDVRVLDLCDEAAITVSEYRRAWEVGSRVAGKKVMT